jgi:hypothetical protein
VRECLHGRRWGFNIKRDEYVVVASYLLCRLDCRDKCDTEAVRTRGERSSGSGGAGGRQGDNGSGGGGVTDLICLLLIPPDIEFAEVMVVIHAAEDAAKGDADVEDTVGVCTELWAV